MWDIGKQYITRSEVARCSVDQILTVCSRNIILKKTCKTLFNICHKTEIPKEAVRGRCKLDSFTCKVFKIPIWCICNMPDCIDNMICCDYRKCRTWFHRKCLNIDSQRNEWQCPSCEIQND